ncbi:MAG TPA: hypothetical protein VK395_19585 [Gemmataceae bacterium]|nr:hypothetical protein [Gemmataceae bacterium]
MLGNIPATLPVDPDDVLWFGRMLQEKGIDVHAQISPAIKAARDLGIIMSLMNCAADKISDKVCVQAVVPATFDISLATATISMIRSLRRVISLKPELLDSAWRLIALSSPVSIPQRRTSERDHIWEILNAAVYSHFGEGVQLNDANAGVDVRGTFGGTPWGIECKILYAERNERRIDRIVDGVKQLESDESVARGVVVVNITDCIDHKPFQQSMTDPRSMFRSTEEALAALKSAVRDFAFKTSTATFQRRVLGDKHGRPRRKCRAVIFIGQTVALAARRVNVYISQFTTLRSPYEAIDKNFANRYHDGWRQLQD